MAKKVERILKLQIVGGQANPAPPVGPALGQAGINIMEFCKAFNAKTQEKAGTVIPVEITVYADKSFTFKTKTKSGSGEPNLKKVGTVTWSQCKDIAQEKMEDLNAFDIEAGAEMIAGTARSMGLRVNRDK